MPKACSSDLRWRIVWSYLYRGQDIEEVAEQFFVCTRTVQRFVDLFLNTGDVTTEHRKPGPSKKLSETEQLILFQILFENPGIYLDEIKEKLQVRVDYLLPIVPYVLKCMNLDSHSRK